jgi:uncharacterized membrane protein YphA (DoxX/SURF4 family)
MIREDQATGLQPNISGRGKVETLASFLGLSLSAVAIYLFDVNSTLSLLGFLGVKDTDTPDLIACAAALAIGLFATIYLEKKRPNASEKFDRWAQTIIRYLLAYIFLLYGFAKVFEQQFHSSLSAMDAPMGDASGLQITWRFFGYSYAYTLFVASSQILSSILFFFRRTATLGAMILLPVISNIVFVNFSHQIPVKLYSTIYLMMTAYLLLIDRRRLKALFWDNKPFEGRVTGVEKSRGLVAVKCAVVFLLISVAVIDNAHAYITYSKATTPLYGAWEVEQYRINDALEESGQSRWKKVYFESDHLLSIKSDRPGAKLYFLTLDSESRSIRLEDPVTESIFLEGSYEMESVDRMIIKAKRGEDAIETTLSRVKKKDS